MKITETQELVLMKYTIKAKQARIIEISKALGKEKSHTVELQARVDRLENGLREITEAKGAYSQDIMEHAENTIRDMVDLAKEALLKEEKKDE